MLEILVVDEASYMVDMITALRAYEANITAIDATKSMLSRTLDIIRD